MATKKLISLDNLSSYSTALAARLKAAKGAANGVAQLDSSGKVPVAQLPSYVSDVLEYDAKSNFPETGEDGKIYVDKATNLTYRWGGTSYVEISPSVALGETSSTAYAGDKGKANADAIATLQTKVSSLEAGTITVDDAINDISTNPVQNKVISAAWKELSAKVNWTDAQMAAINSGITAAKVTAYDGYASQISAKQDTLTAGENITISDGTISAKDTTYSAATTAADGLMSAADKSKLDGMEDATDAEVSALVTAMDF